MIVETLLFKPDGLVPNNPMLPLVLYRGALPLLEREPEQAIIDHFARHRWGDAWIDGIYDFQHYHATAHEVLGLARGHAEVQMGGRGGPVLRITLGDVMLIPAGVGHCRITASRDLSVVGAYPAGQIADLRRDTAADHADAEATIAKVPLPTADPVTGEPSWPR